MACVAAQLNGVKRHRSMKASSRDQQLGLASPLNYAAIQSGKTKTPLRSEEKRAGAGCKLRAFRGEGENFFLTSSFTGCVKWRVESRTGAVVLASRWLVTGLSPRRLNPVWHDAVSCSPGRAVARPGLRMMPASPPLPLKFRRADFLRYGFKAGISDGAFPSATRSSRRAVCRHPSCSSLGASCSSF